MAKNGCDLIARREQAMDSADCALDRAWPERKGQEYVREMESVARELEAIAGEMRTRGVDPIETSRAYRYLGSVYSDLAPALGNNLLARARDAYQKAEMLLEGHSDTLERARLDFNFGNTLRQLDPNDVKQLQEAERRFVAARKVFVERSPQHVPSVDEALSSTRGLLKIAQVANTVEPARADMQGLKAQLAGGGNPSEIAPRVQEVFERHGGVTALFTALQGIVNELPDSAKQSPKHGKLSEQMERLISFIRGGDGPADPQEREIIQLLRDKLSEEVKAGRVIEDRATTLANLLDEFGRHLGSGSDDIRSMMTRHQQMREKIEGQFENLHYLSHGIPRPPEGSRAADLVELWWGMRLFLLQEVNRSGKSQGESKLSFDLNDRATGVDKRIYDAGNANARAALVEKEAIRPLAEEIRRFASRHHPLLASPIWSVARMKVDTNAVFFSGSHKDSQQVDKVCRELGLELMSMPKGESIANARWGMLVTANVTVFDLSVPEGPDRAAVAYELGMARTLGRPVVVLARHDQDIPFDVDVEPIRLSGTTRDIAAVSDAIDRALVWTMPRPRSSAVAKTIGRALHLYSIPHADTYVDQTLKQLQRLQSDQDPVATTSALETLVNFLGDEGLMLIHPVWPPEYPEPDTIRLFHVMPFQPNWANKAAARVEAACAAKGVHYVRGDRVRDANVIRSIWKEINQATHVLIDLTGFNANVALELGIAHTLGRPTLMLGRGNTVKRLFPMITKQRFYPYKSVNSLELDNLVNVLLT